MSSEVEVWIYDLSKGMARSMSMAFLGELKLNATFISINDDHHFTKDVTIDFTTMFNTPFYCHCDCLKGVHCE